MTRSGLRARNRPTPAAIPFEIRILLGADHVLSLGGDARIGCDRPASGGDFHTVDRKNESPLLVERVIEDLKLVDLGIEPVLIGSLRCPEILAVPS